MMKFKKFLAAAMTGAMMFSTVAVAVPAVHVYADEQTTTTTLRYKVDVNYSEFSATIYSTEKKDTYIVFEVLKDDSGSKVSATYLYPVKTLTLEDNTTAYGAKVDLSFLKATKDCYIRAYGDSEKVPADKTGIVTVNKQAAKFSMKYTPGKAAAEWFKAFKIGSSEVSKADDLGAYEFRTLYGSTFNSLLTDFDSATAEVAGTTIVVRKKAVTEMKTQDTVLAPASAEVKVKIAAAPKAPKITVDYVKDSIKLPKNAQLAVIYSGKETTEKVLDLSNDLYIEVTNKESVDEADLINYFKVTTDGSDKSVTLLDECDIDFYVHNENDDTYTKVTAFSGILKVGSDDESNDIPVFEDDAELFIDVIDYEGIDEVETYFKIAESGDTAEKLPSAPALYSYDEDNNTYTEVIDFSDFVSVKPVTSPAESTMTTWERYANGGAVDKKTILQLFTDTKSDTMVEKLIGSGFTLLVRTQKTNKAASIPAFVPIKEVSTLALTTGKNELKLGSNTLTWDNAEIKGKKGVKFTVSGSFEYWDNSKNKWTALKNNYFVEVTSATTFKVRTTGVKVDKNDPSKAAFPSVEYPINLAPEAEAKLTVTPEAQTINADGTGLPTLVVKFGDGANDTIAAANIDWTVKKGEGNSAEDTTELSVAAGVVTKDTNATLTAGTVYILTGKVKDGDFKDKTVTVKLTVAAQAPAPAATLSVTPNQITLNTDGTNASEAEDATLALSVTLGTKDVAAADVTWTVEKKNGENYESSTDLVVTNGTISAPNATTTALTPDDEYRITGTHDGETVTVTVTIAAAAEE